MNKNYSKIIILILLATGLNLELRSQNDKVLFVEFKSIRPKEAVPFSCSEVIDNRRDTSKLGFIYKGSFEEKMTAKFRGVFANYLEEKFKRVMGPKAGREELILIFHQLEYKRTTWRWY